MLYLHRHRKDRKPKKPPLLCALVLTHFHSLTENSSPRCPFNYFDPAPSFPPTGKTLGIFSQDASSLSIIQGKLSADAVTTTFPLVAFPQVRIKGWQTVSFGCPKRPFKTPPLESCPTFGLHHHRTSQATDVSHPHDFSLSRLPKEPHNPAVCTPVQRRSSIIIRSELAAPS
ncbi:unnamed protein product [Cyclocybe aegerita]|uniref:Uncharacterized protein n=1 Tax=Cyclocybe aegerita TaxID=1973307 RepID=A0A8S0VR06_CYCAE|nr:unnamed protein product [Cyclocybe aegerita]